MDKSFLLALLFECVLILLAAATAWGLGLQRASWVRGIRRAFVALARRRAWAIATVAIVALVIDASLSLIRLPAPTGHDEFSYLLAADTFAHGRLTNPTHPMWVHFESFHIIHQPTYMSKYPPLQGMTLAVGIWLGHPIIGVWLSTAAAAAACCWMFQQWMPARWALLGGLMIALHTAVQIHWGQCFWGGSVALSGGALLYGAVRRIWRQVHWRSALTMAAGLAILANSRPFEGFVASLPAAAAMLVWLATNSTSWSTKLSQLVAPVGLALLATGASMAYYNHAVTGSATTMPYQVHERTYAIVPLFLWQELKPAPTYHHQVIANIQLRDVPKLYWLNQRTLADAAREKSRVLGMMWHLLLKVVLTIPLLAALTRGRTRWVQFAACVMLVSLAASSTATWVIPHYLAPSLPLLFLLVIEGARALRCWKRHPGVGRSLVTGLTVTYVVLFVVSCAGYTMQAIGIPRPGNREWGWKRVELLRELERRPGKHLVLVRYASRTDEQSPAEWVFNRADIDGSKIIWAREMDATYDQEIMDYFSDRRVWRLDALHKPPKLEEIRRP